MNNQIKSPLMNNQIKSPLITSPAYIMGKEIKALGDYTTETITDLDFENTLRAIIIKGFSDFSGQRYSDHLEHEFALRKDLAIEYVTKYINDELWVVGSKNVILNLYFNRAVLH